MANEQVIFWCMIFSTLELCQPCMIMVKEFGPTHIEGLTKGASQKSGSLNETDLLNSYLVNLSHLVNQKTFMGHLL